MVVQSEERAGLNGGKWGSGSGHVSPDKLPRLRENRANPPGCTATLAAPLPTDSRPIQSPLPMAIRAHRRPAREKLLARGPGPGRCGSCWPSCCAPASWAKACCRWRKSCWTRPCWACQRQGHGGFGGIAGLLHTSTSDLERIKGLGPAKRAELVAVLELARRALAQQLRERGCLTRPMPSSTTCSCTWPPRGTRCLPCCSSMRKTACWAWKSCFAARSRRPACTRARWCCAPCTTRPPAWCWRTTTPAAACNPAGQMKPSRRP